ncbi:MAG: fibronectin type III domain-containing protein [Planctomycetia bacterium]|nr:fibronectin type III domain-containing protein [Planctomycetia bacterium]
MKFFSRQAYRQALARSRRRSLSLQLEMLEDRWVPAQSTNIQLLADHVDPSEQLSVSGSPEDDHARHLPVTSRMENMGGRLYELTWDPAPAAGDGTGGSSGSGSGGALNPLSSIPVLNSFPSATASIYLDFNGHFDAAWGSYRNITTPVFDQDNDPSTFSDSELDTIRNIWTIVAEDYAPFKINVTTVEPPSFANGVALRVAIGGDGAWTGGSYGGIAYIRSFTSSIVNTAYVFPDNLSNGAAKYTADASSHEAGHSFGLQHQSQYDASGNKISEYYYGPGDGRAPIMGTSYYATRGLWWYGTSSTGANIYQDDMAIISNATNAFGYRADDIPGSTPLTVTGREVTGAGNIERLTDQDSFTLTVAATGEMNLSADVINDVGNLNTRLELRSSQGALLASSDPVSFGFKRTVTYNVTPGNYVLVAASHGSYGDVGKYSISGTIPVPSTIATPTNLVASAMTPNQVNLSWIDNANNEDNYLVERSTTGGPEWTTLATLAADSNSYSDITAISGTTYYYRVSAFNAGEVSSYSNQASVTTVPDAPGNLAATATWSNSISVAWNSVTNATGYKLERSFDGGSNWTLIANPTNTSYSDSGLQASTTYAYRVKATGLGGDSNYSNTASATTYVAPPTQFGPQDGAYVADNWLGSHSDVKIQSSDQKIVAMGSANNAVVIGRYDTQGRVDTTYGNGGILNPSLSTLNERGTGLVLQTDGKAVISFIATYGLDNTQHGVARFTTNGLLDSSFGSGGWNTVDVRPDDEFLVTKNAVGLQSTGKVVIASQSNLPTPNIDPALVARFTAAGALDSGKNGFGTVSQGKAIGYTMSTFGGSSNYFNDLVVQPDDKIVAVGFSLNDSTGGFLVARYTASGALDTSFNGSGYGSFLPAGATTARVFGVTRQSDGKIIVVGNCTGIDGAADMLVARLNTNGTLDTTFGIAGYAKLDIDGTASQTTETSVDVVIQPDGKIVVVGSETPYSATTSYPSNVLVARFNTNGSPDTTFGSGGFRLGVSPPELGSPSMSTNSVALRSNGDIIVAGSLSGHPYLMRFFSTPTPLLAAATPTTNDNTQSITQSQAQPLLTEAIARWRLAGFNVSSLSNINFRIAELPGTTLGQVQGNTITLDSNAAGWGWFVDKTPGSDSEFRMRGNQGEQNRMDLVSVLMHETGHMLGMDHQHSGVMADTLFAGVRLSPPISSNHSAWSGVNWSSLLSELLELSHYQRR